MQKLMAMGALCAALATAAQAETLALDGIGNSRDVRCKGQDVAITGNANRFRLSVIAAESRCTDRIRW